MYAVVADDSRARKQRSRSYNVGDSDNMDGMKAAAEIKGIAVKIICYIDLLTFSTRIQSFRLF